MEYRLSQRGLKEKNELIAKNLKILDNKINELVLSRAGELGPKYINIKEKILEINDDLLSFLEEYTEVNNSKNALKEIVFNNLRRLQELLYDKLA